MTTSVAWEGWSLPSVTAGTSVGTRGCWGGQAPAPTALLQSVPGASSTAAAPWQAPAMGNVTPPSLTYVRQDPRVTVLGSREDTGGTVPSQRAPSPSYGARVSWVAADLLPVAVAVSVSS